MCKKTYLDSFISRSSRQPVHLRMPIASEHRARVCRELEKTSFMSPHVPQLDIAILGDGGEGVRLVWTKLDISDRLCVTVGRLSIITVDYYIVDL